MSEKRQMEKRRKSIEIFLPKLSISAKTGAFPLRSGGWACYTGGEVRNMLTFDHFNFNVTDLERSLHFYKEALGLEPVGQRKEAADGRFIIVYLGDGKTDFRLELTWLRDHPQKYDLGELEYHLALRADDYEAAHKKHEEMGCICFENPEMGIYFITDPDGYWIEIIPTR